MDGIIVKNSKGQMRWKSVKIRKGKMRRWEERNGDGGQDG
jgi:hypothetical protein